MSLKIMMNQAGPVLWVRASGTAVLADMFEMIDMIALEVERCGARRIVVDQTGIIEDFRFTDHFAIGERVSMTFGLLDRAASIVRPSRRTGTSEKVANKQGVALRVFTSEAQARDWIEESS